MKAAARRRLAEAEAARSIAEVGVTPIGNPLDALADLAAEATAWKDHLANVVAQLRDQYRFTDEKGAEHLDARVALFERAMDRCQKFLTDWVRLGFEERMVRVQEAQVVLLAELLGRVVDRLGLGDRATEIREALAVELRAIETKGRPAPAGGANL